MNRSQTSRLLWSLLFAVAIIAAAFLFKGTPAGGWGETALTGAALSFVVLRSPVCTR